MFNICKNKNMTIINMKTSFWFGQVSRRVNGISQDNGGDHDEGCGGDDNRMFKQVNRK